jgi:hypothetical protein
MVSSLTVSQFTFVEEMTPKQNLPVGRLTYLPCQRYASSGAELLMPRLLWKDGITSLSELTAKYKVGIMLTIVSVLLQDK